MNIKFEIGRTIKTSDFEFYKPCISIEDTPKITSYLRDMERKDKEYPVYETPEECYERLSKLCHYLLDIETEKINTIINGDEDKAKAEWVERYNKVMNKGEV